MEQAIRQAHGAAPLSQ